MKEPFLIGRFLGIADKCNHKMVLNKRLKRHTTLAVFSNTKKYPLTLSLPECLMEFCKVTLTF